MEGLSAIAFELEKAGKRQRKRGGEETEVTATTTTTRREKELLLKVEEKEVEIEKLKHDFMRREVDLKVSQEGRERKSRKRPRKRQYFVLVPRPSRRFLIHATLRVLQKKELNFVSTFSLTLTFFLYFLFLYSFYRSLFVGFF